MTMKRRAFLFTSLQAGAGLAIAINPALASVIASQSDALSRMAVMFEEIDRPEAKVGYMQLGDEAFAAVWHELTKHHPFPVTPRINSFLSFQAVPFKRSEDIDTKSIKFFLNVPYGRAGKGLGFHTITKALV